MGIVLKGGPVAKFINEKTKNEIETLKKQGVTPKLGIIQVGQRPDDTAYRNSIVKKCNALGIDTEVYPFPETIKMDSFIERLEAINEDELVHGLLVFRPLPKHIDIEVVRHKVAPIKDIDCMNPVNLEKVFEGGLDGFSPCTPKAVIELLKFHNIPIKGANIAVVNSSLVVGKPLSMLLLSEKGTVTICHSQTKNLKEITNKADIVVTAIGRGKHFSKDYFDTHSVVVDVGINSKDGKLCGDVNYEEVESGVQAITPVPGGVGTVTTSILLNHVVKACRNQMNQLNWDKDKMQI